jgi:hypothetical protein
MGMDVTAYLIYGMPIPKDLLTEDSENTGYDFAESLVYGNDAKYPELDLIIKDSEQNEYYLAAEVISNYWLDDSERITELKVDPFKLEVLDLFCCDYDQTYEPAWYLFCHMSN